MTLAELTANLVKILPLSIIILWACVLLLVDLFIPKDRKAWTAILASVGMVHALGSTTVDHVGPWRPRLAVMQDIIFVPEPEVVLRVAITC